MSSKCNDCQNCKRDKRADVVNLANGSKITFVSNEETRDKYKGDSDKREKVD